LNIDIISDVVCPWCYIGKRQIEAALALYAQQHPGADKPSLSWRPFQLNPQLPAEGMSRQEYVVQKFGAARAKDIYARVAGVGTVGRRAPGAGSVPGGPGVGAASRRRRCLAIR